MLRDADGTILPMKDAPALPGAHNAQNAAAAAAIAGVLGLSRGEIARGMRSYPGLPHRQQRVATIGGVAFVNDSKATNADAAARAIGCYDRLVWIAGGIAKEGGIESLAPLFPRIARAFLIGRDAPALAATLAAHGVRHRIAGTLDAAVPPRSPPPAPPVRTGRAAVAGLRQLRPVQRLRCPRRSLRRACRAPRPREVSLMAESPAPTIPCSAGGGGLWTAGRWARSAC